MRGTRGVGSVYQPKFRDRATGELKPSSIWWVRYYHHGRKFRESSGSTCHASAVRLLKRRLGEIGSGKPVGPDVDRTMFEDLAKMVILDYEAKGKKSHIRVEHALNHLRQFFGEFRARDITSDRVTEYVAGRRTPKPCPRCQGNRKLPLRDDRCLRCKGTGQLQTATATINRELAALKYAFRLATKAGRVGGRPEISLGQEYNAREGFIEQAEFGALRDALPRDLKDPVTFLWLSGWRVGEMRTLQWRDIYADAIRLRPENSKNKRGREFPLIGELAEVIVRAREQRRLDCQFVFHRGGNAIGSFRKSWATACGKAGLVGLLVHDIRRSAARNLIRAGVSENVAMQFTGHKTTSIFRRYDIVSGDDLAAAAALLQTHLAKSPSEIKVVAIGSRA